MACCGAKPRKTCMVSLIGIVGYALCCDDHNNKKARLFTELLMMDGLEIGRAHV